MQQHTSTVARVGIGTLTTAVIHVMQHNQCLLEDFIGLFAIDMASHIGLKLKGVKGGIVGAVATALPSIVAILLIAMFFQTFKDNIYVEKIFMGVRPCVVALILAPCFGMAKKAKLNRFNWWIPVVTAVLISAFGVSPIWCILAAGVGGFIWGKVVDS